MTGRFKRFIKFSAPVVIAAMGAALLAGLVEGITHLSGALAVVASAGFSAPYALLLGVVAGLIARLLWVAWRPHELLAHLAEDPDGVTPRLAGWLTFLLLAVAITGAVAFNFTRWLVHSSDKVNVIGLASALSAVAVGATLVVISRPAVSGLSRPFRWLTRYPRMSRLMRPGPILATFAALAAISAYISWRISFVPRIGDLDLGIELYLGVWSVTLIIGFALARRVTRRRHLAIASATLAVACIATIATAVSFRMSRPSDMLDIWGTETVSGLAVDLTYDVNDLREEVLSGTVIQTLDAGEAPRDVLLLTIDTLRADQTPMYGGAAKMPRLARLAESSTVFEWAFAPSNVTRRSLPAIITGLDPVRIRGRLKGWALVMDPRHILLAERFRAAGYDTAGFFCCETHFDKERIGTTRGIDHVVLDRNEKRMIKNAAKWLQTKRRPGPERKPVFVWVHVYKPHDWHKRYKKDKRTRPEQTFEDSYRSSLTETDLWLQPLFAYLERSAVKESMIVAVTSDHGEALGHKGVKFHSSNLFNTQIRVPLLIRLPGQSKGERVEQPVSLIDLFPTLMEAAGYQPVKWPTVDGQSLLPLLGDKVVRDDQAVVLSHQIRDRSVSRRIDTIVTDRHKLIISEGERPMLFDLAADPEEKQDLASQQPERVKRMSATLRAQMKRLRTSPF